MTTAELTAEAAAKVGLDYDTARDLHRRLCDRDHPTAALAAELLLQAIDHYAAGDRIVRRIADLTNGC